MRLKIGETAGCVLALVVGVLLIGPAGYAAGREVMIPGAGPESLKPYGDSILEIFRTLLVLTEADPEEGAAPLTVHFTADVHEGYAAENPRFKWNFGDGSPAVKEQSPTHIYTKPGRYRVVASAIDDTERRGESEALWIEVRKSDK